jgi:hypothetical protein
METTNEYAVFLDVDGVINSINHLYTRGDIDFDAETLPHPANGYTVWVPDYMSSLVQWLYNNTDLYWLTTWRDNANQHISPILGIPDDIPVIDDGTKERAVHWKFDACLPLAQELAANGQKVYWIEDFGGRIDPRHSEYLTYVDTDRHDEGVLLPQHLPLELQDQIIEHGGYDGPLYLKAPRKKTNFTVHNRNFGVDA